MRLYGRLGDSVKNSVVRFRVEMFDAGLTVRPGHEPDLLRPGPVTS